MFRNLISAISLLIMVLVATNPANAVNPDEMLNDPVLEARARALSVEIRCLVCQNQNIDDSDAELARDLRLLVRERLTGGDSDREVMDYLVARYGEFILLKPRLSTTTFILWSAPFVLLLIGGAVLLTSMRGRKKRATQPLSAEEQASLALIMDEGKENR